MSHEDTILEGIVYKKATGTYWVDVDGTAYTCSVSAKLRKQLIYPTRDRSSLGHLVVDSVKDITMVDPVAVGDQVLFRDAGNNDGLITEVLPRHSKLTRRAPGPKPLEHVLVANVDQVVVVLAATNPPPKWRLLDRYLVSAEVSEIPVTICINKIDLLDERKRARKFDPMMAVYQGLGYNVIVTSATKRLGLDSLKENLQGKTSVLVGLSGMGKSTLLNALQPGLGITVSEMNMRIQKGRHTTTNAELHRLEFGGAVIDTPGIKTFGLWNIDPDEVALFFREMAPYVGTCKFGMSCTHDHEPDCAIKEAVETGDIDQNRYKSYLYLRENLYAEE